MTELPFPPDKSSSDRAYDVTKIIVGAVPVLGGNAQAALELFGPPLERRRERWLEELWSFVNDLANRLGRTVDEFVNDERFLSAVVQATSTALGQHVEAKIDMLKAVPEHEALEPDRGDVVTARFLPLGRRA